MIRIVLTASVLALAACGGPDADENPGDLNVVDNVVGPGNVMEVPTGNGIGITPTENGFEVDVPGAGNAAGGNAGAPAANAAAPATNGQ